MKDEKFPSVFPSHHIKCAPTTKKSSKRKLAANKSWYEFFIHFHVTTFTWISNGFYKMWDLCINRLCAVEGERWFRVSCIKSKTNINLCGWSVKNHNICLETKKTRIKNCWKLTQTNQVKLNIYCRLLHDQLDGARVMLTRINVVPFFKRLLSPCCDICYVTSSVKLRLFLWLTVIFFSMFF